MAGYIRVGEQIEGRIAAGLDGYIQDVILRMGHEQLKIL